MRDHDPHGIAHCSPIEHTTDAMARAMFETNVFGPLRTIRAVLPSMRARQPAQEAPSISRAALSAQGSGLRPR